jgi:hypothetical protein
MLVVCFRGGVGLLPRLIPGGVEVSEKCTLRLYIYRAIHVGACQTRAFSVQVSRNDAHFL